MASRARSQVDLFSGLDRGGISRNQTPLREKSGCQRKQEPHSRPEMKVFAHAVIVFSSSRRECLPMRLGFADRRHPVHKPTPGAPQFRNRLAAHSPQTAFVLLL